MIHNYCQRPGYELARLPAEGRGYGAVRAMGRPGIPARLTLAGTAPTRAFWPVLFFLNVGIILKSGNVALVHSQCYGTFFLFNIFFAAACASAVNVDFSLAISFNSVSAVFYLKFNSKALIRFSSRILSSDSFLSGESLYICLRLTANNKIKRPRNSGLIPAPANPTL